MIRKIVLGWIVFNLACLLGAALLLALGKLSDITQALPTLIIFALLSLVSITLRCIFTGKTKDCEHEKS